MVEIFDDWVEIHNPGGLPKGMTLDQLGKKSVVRNKIIANMLLRADYIERMGTGIKKIRELMEEAELDMPEFESDYFFTVIFKRPPMHVLSIDRPAGDMSLKLPAGLNENEKRVCEIIFKYKNLTFNNIAEYLEISESTVTRTIRSLTEKGIIMRIGPKKGGSWKFLI